MKLSTIAALAVGAATLGYVGYRAMQDHDVSVTEVVDELKEVPDVVIDEVEVPATE